MCTIVPLTISNAPRLMFPMTWLSMKCLIAARHLEKSESRVHLFEARHEWMLRQEIYKVTLYRETQSQLVREDVRFTPDGWLDFRITSRTTRRNKPVSLLEMDMDTHQKPRFQKKIASYVAFINEGLYEQALQDNQCGDRLCHANR